MKRFFTWKPQWFYSWPVKIVRGGDENDWHTIGIVTWAGSIFYRSSQCNPTCPRFEWFSYECRGEVWSDYDETAEDFIRRRLTSN